MKTLTVNLEESWTGMAQRIARERGHYISGNDADIALWEFTAFPFDRPERIAEQLDRLFASMPAREVK